MRLAILPIALLLGGCGKPATVEDCEKIVERITALKLQAANVKNPAEVASTVTKTKQAFRSQAMEQCVGRRITGEALSCVEQASTAEEIGSGEMDAQELTKLNAKLKAEEVAGRFPDAVVLGADTLVTIDGQVLGKPTDREGALDMLHLLNGRTHQVMTGVCLMQTEPSVSLLHCEVTEVSFKTLSDVEIREYHQLIDPMDKAGAYAAQEHGEVIIELTDGSWSNVVGLPMEPVKSMLEELSIYPDPALT